LTVRYGLDERLATRTHWAFPEYMRVELEHYLGLDAKLAASAGCATCGGRLSYPLVELPVGGSDLLLHPGCAEEIGRNLLNDCDMTEASEEAR